MYNTKMVDDLIAIGRHIAGDKWDRNFEFQLNGLKKMINEANARSDFELLIGGIVEPNINDLHKKIEGNKVLSGFTWDSINDVPKNFTVIDEDGDVWRFRDNAWHYIDMDFPRGWHKARPVDLSGGRWSLFYDFKE